MRRYLPAFLTAIFATGFLSTAVTATGPGSWNRVGNGGNAMIPSLNGTVSALHRVGTDLYVGGVFTNAGGLPKADRIARWNGTSWKALGATPLGSGAVFAIAHYGGKIYAGGNFVNAGNDAAADYLAVFDGVSWGPFCNTTSGPAFGNGFQVTSLQVVDTTLYVGGTFQNANGNDAADYLVGCDLVGGGMTALVAGGLDHQITGGIYALTADSNGTLYAGGVFTNLDGNPDADRIAAYDGTWHGVGATRLTGIVRALTASGTDVYVSTDESNIAGDAKADHVVKWDGVTYSSLGSNTAGTDGWMPASTTIQSMTVSGSLLFVAGGFSNANGQATADNVAFFDGTTWRRIGSNGAGNGAWNGEGHALAVVNGLLYAGGSFTGAGGDTKAFFVASRSLTLPDAEIGNSGGNYVGNDVYSPSATGEVKTIHVARGSSQYFPILIHNDGLVPASFKLKGTGAATGYTLKFINFANNANITAAVKSGTFSTGILAPGQSFAMKMVVTLAGNAASTGTFTVKASSRAGTPPDAVKGIVKTP
jgi:hypothetical protein